MEQRVTDFFEMLRTRKVGLVGFGVTNNGIARMLAAKGIHVTIHDRQDRKELGEICQEMEEAGVSLSLGYNYLRTLEEDVIFRAPGVPFDLPELTAARKAGKVITSDLEMFFDLCPCPIIGVTGSDGKTTTTTLIAEMLRAQGKRVHLGGNIGKALFPEIETVCPEDYAVVELSSFQLISLRRSPDIAVVTNVSPNHLDIHGTMKEYVAAKRNILLHQNAFSRTVLNADNDLTRKYIPDVRGCVCTFSRQTNVHRGAWEDSSGTIWYSDNGSQTRIMKAEEIRIPGLHNVENYLAAITAVWGIASLESIRKVAHEFAGVEHRIELVRELDGLWSLPGGWVDAGLSVAESAVKEVLEEAGLTVRAERIIAVQDREKHNQPVYAWKICKIFVLCTLLGGAFVENSETTESGYFSLEDLPPLAEEKNTQEQIALCFEAHCAKQWETQFD